MEFPTVFTDVLVDLVRCFSIVLIKKYWRETPFLTVLLKVGPSLSLRRLIPMTLEGLFASPDALRPLTLCNCDCKLLTSAICRGVHHEVRSPFPEMHLL